MKRPLRSEDGSRSTASSDDHAKVIIEQAARFETTIPDGAQDRVLRSIRRRRGVPASSTWPILFSGAAVAAALLLVLVLRSPNGFRVATTGVDESRGELRAGKRLPLLSERSFVDLHAAGQVVSGAKTRALIERFDDTEVRFRLEEGSLLLHVAPRGELGPLIIETPQFIARVVGTVLRVVVHADGRSSIVVAHGAVEVEPRGQPAFVVNAGSRWPADTMDVPDPAEVALLQPADREGVTLGDFSPPSVHAPCDGDAASRVRCQLTIAQDAEPARAENALYEAGWMAWRDLRDAKRALAIWRQQRERFPNGTLRSEVQTSIIDVLIALRMPREAEIEVDRYLIANPEGLRAAEMHFVLGTLQREIDGDCRRADAEFALALEHPAEPWEARAREARTACHPARGQ